jgi:hypothetical protein
VIARRLVSALAALAIAACAGAAPIDEAALQSRFYPDPPPAPARMPDEPAGRAADAAYLSIWLEHEHSFGPAARAEARAQLAALRAEATSLSRQEFVLRVAAIAALADNGHTHIWANAFKKDNLRLPLRMYWFADGLHVVRAKPAFADLLGARIETIDGRPVADIFAAVRRYAGGEDALRRAFLTPLFESPDLLAAAGVAREAQRLTLGGFFADGAPFTRTVDAEVRAPNAPVSATQRLLYPVSSGSSEVWLSAALAAPTPLWLREPGKLFTAAPLDRGGYYISLTYNDDGDEESIGAFLDRATNVIRSARPPYVVLDMRMNDGGDFTTTWPFADQLARTIAPDAQIYVLTSTWTFSAAITTVARLKQTGRDRVVIVGEPVGDRLVFWAEGGAFTLPNTRLQVSFTTGLHDYTRPCRDRSRCYWLNERFPARAPTLAPDVAAPLTFAAWAAGRDPALDAVMAREAATPRRRASP